MKSYYKYSRCVLANSNSRPVELQAFWYFLPFDSQFQVVIGYLNIVFYVVTQLRHNTQFFPIFSLGLFAHSYSRTFPT